MIPRNTTLATLAKIDEALWPEIPDPFTHPEPAECERCGAPAMVLVGGDIDGNPPKPMGRLTGAGECRICLLEAYEADEGSCPDCMDELCVYCGLELCVECAVGPRYLILDGVGVPICDEDCERGALDAYYGPMLGPGREELEEVEWRLKGYHQTSIWDLLLESPILIPGQQTVDQAAGWVTITWGSGR